MKKSVYTLAVIIVLSASTFTASAREMTSQVRGGSDPRPQVRGGSDPRPQSVVGTIYSTVLACLGL